MNQMATLTKLLLLCIVLCSFTDVHGRNKKNLCPKIPKGDNCNIQCFVADPVCGANGVTYACGCPEAGCYGVRVVKKGPC